MAELIDSASEPGTPTTVRDQRRPGRLEHVDPSLIPLLRGKPPQVADVLVEQGDVATESDRKVTLSAARGIVLGAALGGIIWAGIGVGFWYYFG